MSHRQHAGVMSHLLGKWIGNWVSPGSQDFGWRCDKSCFLWCHCRWSHTLGGVHRTCPSMVTGKSVRGGHGCLSLIQCRQCHWLVHLQKVWSRVQRDHQRCWQFAWLCWCTCGPVLGGNYIHSGNGHYQDGWFVCTAGRTRLDGWVWCLSYMELCCQ